MLILLDSVGTTAYCVGMEMRTYACGHEGEIPRFMGRGQARQRRLSVHFCRPCRECRLVRAESYARSLTTMDGRPLSGDALNKAIAKAQARVS